MSRRLPVVVFLMIFNVSVLLAQFGAKVQYFPQFAVGGSAESQFSIHNPGQASITVDIELRRSDGSLFQNESVEVAAGATMELVFADAAASDFHLTALSPAIKRVIWFHLTTGRAEILAFRWAKERWLVLAHVLLQATYETKVDLLNYSDHDDET